MQDINQIAQFGAIGTIILLALGAMIAINQHFNQKDFEGTFGKGASDQAVEIELLRLWRQYDRKPNTPNMVEFADAMRIANNIGRLHVRFKQAYDMYCHGGTIPVPGKPHSIDIRV